MDLPGPTAADLQERASGLRCPLWQNVSWLDLVQLRNDAAAVRGPAYLLLSHSLVYLCDVLFRVVVASPAAAGSAVDVVAHAWQLSFALTRSTKYTMYLACFATG